jgi:hypothetical protein
MTIRSSQDRPTDQTAARRPRISDAAIIRAAALRDRLLKNRLVRGRHLLPACALLGAAATLQGCIAVGGTARHESPTLGRQLIDLKAALDAGAMSEEEYRCAKAQILSSTR